MSFVRPILIVQGGAGTYETMLHDQVSRETIEKGVTGAARVGYEVLMLKMNALDAVEAAVIELENYPCFNAGRGSCLTIDGQIEMDASIMDGSTLLTGGVACIRNVVNPIKVARLVMEKSDHVLFCGDGALTFAESQGIPRVPDDYLITESARKRRAITQSFPSSRVPCDSAKHNAVLTSHSPPPPGFNPDGADHDTVGAVAVDEHGNVAYATSTGGITAKLLGRVGDSPIVGCGGYADNLSGAVSTTGHGESIIKVCLAKHTALLMEQGKPVQEAVEVGLNTMLKRVGGTGGTIAVDSKGNPGIFFTTQGMAWAYCVGEELHWGIYKGEDTVLPI